MNPMHASSKQAYETCRPSGCRCGAVQLLCGSMLAPICGLTTTVFQTESYVPALNPHSPTAWSRSSIHNPYPVPTDIQLFQQQISPTHACRREHVGAVCLEFPREGGFQQRSWAGVGVRMFDGFPGDPEALTPASSPLIAAT